MKVLVAVGPGRVVRCCAVAVVLAWLAGCATVAEEQPGPTPATEVPATARWAAPIQIMGGQGEWVHQILPGKRPTDFQPVRQDGRDAMAARSSSAASLMRYRVRLEPEQLGHLRFSWKVQGLLPDADLAVREREDSPVRILLAFEGDRSRFSPKDSLLSELTRTLTGEEMPYATLMYVWCNTRAPESVIRNARTARIRSIVVESGAGHLRQWIEYQRDIRADYERVFGEPPGPLVGVAIMTDTDNTQSQTRAWYGPLSLLPVHATSAH